MNKYTYLGITGLVATAFFTAPAMATVMMDSTLQTDIKNITTSGPQINTTTDQVSPSSHWVMDASGGSENTVVFQFGGNSNGYSFGIYDPSNISDKVQIFSANAAKGTEVSLNETNGHTYSVNGGSTVTFGTHNLFGYYISGANGTFYSDPSLNKGDHQMVAYEGNDKTYLNVPNGNGPALFSSSEYLLGWNTQGAGNTPSSNYTTGGVYLVESVHPAPEPTILSIFGLGLLMMGLIPRVRRS